MTIVGVMPESMETISAAVDFHAPIDGAPQAATIGLGRIVGRLREGVPLAAASEEANTIGMAIRPPRPASAQPLTRARFEAQNLKDGILGPPPGRLVGAGLPSASTTLWIFAGAAAVVLHELGEVPPANGQVGDRALRDHRADRRRAAIERAGRGGDGDDIRGAGGREREVDRRAAADRQDDALVGDGGDPDDVASTT